MCQPFDSLYEDSAARSARIFVFGWTGPKGFGSHPDDQHLRRALLELDRHAPNRHVEVVALQGRNHVVQPVVALGVEADEREHTHLAAGDPCEFAEGRDVKRVVEAVVVEEEECGESTSENESSANGRSGRAAATYRPRPSG